MSIFKNSATDFIPSERNLAVLAHAAEKCRGCDLYLHATQAVFGELDTHARPDQPQVSLMMIGEQPGDQEDKTGRPFVGPAGKLLDRCLDEAGIKRKEVYLTNAVKHFKWEPRGKIRLHKKPSMVEVNACRPWLIAEIETVKPHLLVCLGATAAQSLLGPTFRITKDHGKLQHRPGLPPLLATLHPSAVLRALTDADRASHVELLIADLRVVANTIREIAAV